MNKREAGRKGGNTTYDRYGTEHFRALAYLCLQKHGGIEHLRAIGKKGGERMNMRYIAGGISGSIHPHDIDPELPL